MTEKAQLRKNLREKIRAFSQAELAECDRGIFENLIRLPRLQAARCVFVYYSMGREVCTHALISWILAEKKTLCLPITYPKGRMEAGVVSDLAELVPGVWNIPQPPESAPRLQPFEIDLVITPGLAFDRRGYRMGQGGGYYDRYLPQVSFSIGLCRDFFLFDALPKEPHDMAVHMVVTEKEIAGLHKEAPQHRS